MFSVAFPCFRCLPELRLEDEPVKGNPACDSARRMVHRLEDLSLEHGEGCPGTKWWRTHGCATFVVDHKPLALVLSGRAPLNTPSLGLIFERMTNWLFTMISCGWTPHDRIADPVQWQRREYNKIADFIVNVCMDRECDIGKKSNSPLWE